MQRRELEHDFISEINVLLDTTKTHTRELFIEKPNPGARSRAIKDEYNPILFLIQTLRIRCILVLSKGIVYSRTDVLRIVG